jgi:hypothetical protein
MTDSTPPSSRARRAVAALLFALLAAGLSPAPGSAACAGGHTPASLTGFAGDPRPPGVTLASRFYAAPEQEAASATITVSPGHCDGEVGRAEYATEDGTAVAGDDYAAITPTWSPELCVDPHAPELCAGKPGRHEVPLDLLDDADPEPPLERFTFRLTQGDPGLREPSSAPVYIVDDDGAATAAFEPETTDYVVSEFGRLWVPVFRTGAAPPGSVAYAVGPPPDGLPAATFGTDVVVESEQPLPAHAFAFGGGRVAFIRFRILGDQHLESDESFSVTLQPGIGYAVGAPGEVIVTIEDNDDDSVAPVTRFHHPRDGLRYRRGDYRIREFHTFYEDLGGAGIAGAQVALRRRKVDGRCAWWRGDRFRAGPCREKVWRAMRFHPALEMFSYALPSLRPTVGTPIASYRAWTRGTDHAGNVEGAFAAGRNVSTFWIRR